MLGAFSDPIFLSSQQPPEGSFCVNYRSHFLDVETEIQKVPEG